MDYFHKDQHAKKINLPLGKVVCVGRNYAKHAIELGNEVPSEPLFFMKPKSALVDLAQPFAIPSNKGHVHFETEIAVLLQADLKQASEREVASAIWGYGLGFDLTLRDLQNRLKENGHPWEKAKAFDGSAPVSQFIEKSIFESDCLVFENVINEQVKQSSNTDHMLWSIPSLLQEMSEHFSLQAGDIIFTGTPEGVGPLSSGDSLAFNLGDTADKKRLSFTSAVL